ncbi:hypothetical protein EYF80_020555 [Liparis tanakae]|uniref:Uncharacterized protein n=1 Tax=Liparis tanakae TaxID=230148 RepID=A0A4Z2HU17_9TELE|nr:hypothetical protein EYF80_020555 [Liparis tanakae]
MPYTLILSHSSTAIAMFIELQHFHPRNDVDFKFGQQVVQQPEVVVNVAFPIPSHAAAWSPEDEHRVLACVEQLLPAPQHPLQAGVSYDTWPELVTRAQVLQCIFRGCIDERLKTTKSHVLTSLSLVSPLLASATCSSFQYSLKPLFTCQYAITPNPTPASMQAPNAPTGT